MPLPQILLACLKHKTRTNDFAQKLITRENATLAKDFWAQGSAHLANRKAKKAPFSVKPPNVYVTRRFAS